LTAPLWLLRAWERLVIPVEEEFTMNAWELAAVFAPLIYIAALGRSGNPTRRLVALIDSVGNVIRRRK
jgi:hypothetical protein